MRPLDEPADIASYYGRLFREGMIDISASSPQPIGFRMPGAFKTEHTSPRHIAKLRGAIARRYRTLSADDVLLCAGASEALVATAHALLERGASVALARGAYPSFVAAARRLGAVTAGPETAGARIWLVTNPYSAR